MRYLLLLTLLAFGSAQTLAQADLAVTSLTLVNAATSEPVGNLTDGTTLDFAALGTNQLSVVATTTPEAVGSVVFSLDDTPAYQVEGLAPYTIAGDAAQNGAVKYNAWTPSVGEHTLTATPYSESGAQGTAGTPLSVRFTVVDGAQAATAPAPSPTPSPIPSQTQVVPEVPTPAEQTAVAETPTPVSESTARLRQERFEIAPEPSAALGGSVLVADYGLNQTILTVLLSGAAAGETYTARLQAGGCDGGVEATALEPIEGRTGMSASAVALDYDALLGGNYYFGLYSATSGQASALSCTLLGR